MLGAIDPAGRPAHTAQEAARTPALEDAAREFESLLLHMMIKAMRQSVERSDVFGDTQHLETYEMLQDQELARSMARGRGIGFAEMIVRQFEGREEEGLRTLGSMGRDLRTATHSYETYGAAPMVPPVDGGGER